MIYQNDLNEKGTNKILYVLKELKLSKLLRESGINKTQGASAYAVFKFLLLLVFQGKNLYRFLNSRYSEIANSKNTYYRFLNNSHYNWRKFLTKLSTQVISVFNKLTKSDRVNVLILDDSTVQRNHSKSVELLAKGYDHAHHKFFKGFTMLTLGWSDGYSFIPVDFSMMSSTKQKNRYQESKKIDKRTNGYKRRREAVLSKPEQAISMVKHAIDNGICADYILMDTWFTTEPMITSLLDLGMDTIGMLKNMKQRYSYRGKMYTMSRLRSLLPKNVSSNILGSFVVQTKQGLKVKIVYIKNRNDKSEWLAILSTDISLSDEEIVRLYGNRWSIEVFFKSSKSFMKLGTEFQGRSYDMLISHTTIVFTRYILMEWIKRNENDLKTFGELFYMFCDDIKDMDLVTALQNLMSLFVEQFSKVPSEIAEVAKSQLLQWKSSQALYIQSLFNNLCWES